MDMEKLVGEVLAEWEDLQDKLEIVAHVLAGQLREDYHRPGKRLQLVQHHFFLAAIKLSDPAQAQREFDQALLVVAMERRRAQKKEIRKVIDHPAHAARAQRISPKTRSKKPAKKVASRRAA